MDFTTGTEDKRDRVARVRLRLAQAFIDMLLYAFDALKTHGVDYRTLPSWKDESLLEETERLPIEQGADSFFTWMGRVKNDIKAAVTRKGFRKV